MKNKTYTVKGNRKAADVVKGNDETIRTGLTEAEAMRLAISVQKKGEFVAAWIEEEPKGSPLSRVAAAATAAKARTGNNPKWTRAIEKAAEGLASGELIVTVLANDHALVTSPNGSYWVNGSCSCAAAQNGHRECYHRAAVRLVEMIENAPRWKSAPVEAPTVREGQPTITRSCPSLGALAFASVAV